ncbi:YgaP family membrane protein [Tabrizicola sp. BL-A-41-H6]|uniref:YgaP family membrane protein n=1 Tax=Tabrizicola sp. BL-A-41-H6 TaxID=3421107 RepID=UPI003D667CA1
MFTTNEGTVDRVLRVAVGLALLVWFYVDQGQGFWHYAKLIGVVPILTGLVGWCPLYTVLGISTCQMKKA